MPNGINPRMPEGVNVFEEIGLGEVGPMAAADRGVSEVFDALQAGDTPSLIRARDRLNEIVNQKIQQAKPTAPAPGPGAPTPAPTVRPAQPVAQAGAAPQAPTRPTPQQATGQAAAQGGQPSPNTASDIAKIIRAASDALAPPSSPAATGKPVVNPLTQGAPAKRI